MKKRQKYSIEDICFNILLILATICFYYGDCMRTISSQLVVMVFVIIAAVIALTHLFAEDYDNNQMSGGKK